MEVDLHMHSIHSDGTYTPEEIVKRAKKNGVKAISLTDHDTVDGVLDGERAAKEFGVEYIKGIEISCNDDGLEVHILGYFLNLEDQKFISEIEELKLARDKRNMKIIENFKKLGIDIGVEELKKYAPGNIISRLHFANYLIDKGIVKDKNEAFSKYLGKTGLAYEAKENFPPERAVKIIKANGGFVSLAHPLLVSKNDLILKNLIKKLVDYGLDGLEAQYKSFTKAEVKYLKKLAKKYKLLVTGGSDFHGDNRVGTDIGDGGLYYNQFELIKKK